MSRFKPRSEFDTNKYEFTIEVSLPLEAFREYIKLTESTLEIELKHQIEDYNDFLISSTDDEIRELYDFADHKIKAETRQLFFNSLFISIYSFLERKMFQLCQIAENNQVIKIRDLSGDGIFKYRKYLTKILNINLDEVNAQWDLFTKFNTLRNLLVHTPLSSIDIQNNSKKVNTLKSIHGLAVKECSGALEFEIKDKQLILNFCSAIEILLIHLYYKKM